MHIVGVGFLSFDLKRPFEEGFGHNETEMMGTPEYMNLLKSREDGKLLID
jgi:hypothetical protein